MRFNIIRSYCDLLLLVTLIQFSHAGKISLEEDIVDGYLDNHSKIEAALILSGVTQPDSLPKYLEWYDNLVAKIKTFAFDLDDPVGSAHTVFMYLHGEWLKTYAMESTTLADIARNKEYNCVSATILYNIICEEFNWTCELLKPQPMYIQYLTISDKRWLWRTRAIWDLIS